MMNDCETQYHILRFCVLIYNTEIEKKKYSADDDDNDLKLYVPFNII